MTFWYIKPKNSKRKCKGQNSILTTNYYGSKVKAVVTKNPKRQPRWLSLCDVREPKGILQLQRTTVPPFDTVSQHTVRYIYTAAH